MAFFQEAIHAPESQISFMKDVYDSFQGKYTHVGILNPAIIMSIRSDLTKNIPRILALIQNESRHAFDKELGNPTEWKAIPLYAKMLRIVALLSGRVFVGLPVSREEEWIQASINYATDIGAVLRASQKWNYLIRPFVAPFLPEIRKAQNDLKIGLKWVAPLVSEIMSGRGGEKSGPVKAGTKGAFISWMLNYLPEHKKTAETVGINQMLVSPRQCMMAKIVRIADDM